MRLMVLTSRGLSSERAWYCLMASSSFPWRTSLSAASRSLARFIAISGSFPRTRRRNAPEGQPMKRSGAEAEQRAAVLLRAVALVPGEPVFGVEAVEILHHLVPVDLGENRGCRDGEAAAISVDQAPLGQVQPGKPHSVDEEDIR